MNRVVITALVILVAAMPAAASAQTAPADMVLIPAGAFEMGSTSAETNRWDVLPQFVHVEQPQHRVTVNAFFLAKHDVTRAQFAEFAAATGFKEHGCHVWDGFKWSVVATASWRHPGFAQTDRDPAVCVSVRDAEAYAAWYSKKNGRTFRLPTEAQWEYAARAGTSTSRFWGDDLAKQCRYANGSSMSYSHAFPQEPDVDHACADGFVYTSPVGTFKPNSWGLYDMLGDVWQWTADCANKNYDGAPADGSAWKTGKCAVHPYRGGSWYDGAWLLRSAARNFGKADQGYNGVGFRLAAS